MIKANELRWRPVAGFEGLYEISETGIVKSIGRRAKSSSENGRAVNEKILSVTTSGKYPSVCISKDGKSRNYVIHRLLAFAFIPNPLGKLYINHKDGNKKNYNLDNLEWCTLKENAIHAFATGLSKPIPGKRGEANRMCKLKNVDVEMIKVLLQHDFTHEQIATRFGIHSVTVSKIKRGKIRIYG